MLALLKLIPDSLKLPLVGGLGLVLGASLMFYPAKWIGASGERQAAQIRAAADTIRILKERGKIDDQVNSSDAAVLCGSYGLSDDDKAECVRRVSEAPAISGNDGHNPAH